MTQAFNLSQLANGANTSGQLNASSYLYNQVPVANGGTALSSAGAAGNMLVASSASAYSSVTMPTFGYRNRIINGDMRINQRASGTVNITSNTFVVDRFKGFRSGGSATITGQQSTTAPSGFSNSVLLTVGTGATPGATDYTQFDQNIEGFNVADLAWGTASAQSVTLSFWVRSSLTGTFGVAFRNDAGNRSYVGSYTISAANTFEYKTITIPGDTSGTWLKDISAGIKMTFDVGVGSTYSNAAGSWASANYFGLTGGVKLTATAGATFYITGVQLEKGSIATAFDFRDYGRELMMCQRYFCTVDMTVGNAIIDAYVNANDTYANTRLFFPVIMRAAPTGTLVATITYSNRAGSETVSPGAITTAQAWTGIRANALGRVYALVASNNAQGNTYTFSAEL